MDNIDDTAVKMLIHRVGLKFNLQDSIVNKIVNSPYKFTKHTIVNMDVSSVESEEDFNELKTNFIYKYIGKVYCTYGILSNHRKRSERFTEYHKLNKVKNE
jgi:hypothetical protein